MGLDDALNGRPKGCALPTPSALRKDQFDDELSGSGFWIVGESGVPIVGAKTILLESHSLSWVVWRSFLLCECY